MLRSGSGEKMPSCVTWPAAAGDSTTACGRVPEIAVWEAAEETTTATKAGVRSSRSLCGSVGATDTVESCRAQRSLSSDCLVVVDVRSATPRGDLDDRDGTCSRLHQSLSNSELSLQSVAVCTNTDHDRG